MLDDSKPMEVEVIEDTAGKPIFKVDGILFFYEGKTIQDDLVWQAESDLVQLVFVAPDFEVTEYRSGLENLLVCRGAAS